jgi:hypothetical protein
MPVEARDRSQPYQINFQANPIQYAFITSRAEADLWACRMGDGKSTGLAWSAFHFCQANPGATGALIRDTFENLRDTTMKDFFEWFPPGVCGEFNANNKLWKWRLGEMRGELMMMGMDDPGDATKLQSRELGYFLMDEPAPAAESGGIAEEIFNTAMTRLRQPAMKWYGAKLAENAPDETHWTYRRFVDPGDEGTPADIPICEHQRRGFRFFQGPPENEKNLPPGYYARLRQALKHRPDLIRRFADGGFGFQQIGQAVTPQWNDAVHLGEALEPVPGVPLHLCWDFGLNPTCHITQVTPLGFWIVLETHVGYDIGAYELIRDVLKTRLGQRFKGYNWNHIGDPAGLTREQSSSKQSAVGVIKKELGGRWTSGPQSPISARIDPLCSMLSKLRNGRGVVQVDKQNAQATWHALRGGWHYHVSRTGMVSQIPRKDDHSHPGDALGYGAAVLFPLGKLYESRRGGAINPKYAKYRRGPLGFERPGLRVPKDGESLKETPNAQ